MISFNRPLKLAVIFDQEIGVGGGYKQSLNAILDVKKLPSDLVEPIYFTYGHGKVEALSDLGISAHHIEVSLLNKIISAFRRGIRHESVLRLVNAALGPNVFERALLRKKIDLVYFLSPSAAARDLEELNFIFTLWDMCYRDEVEFPEIRKGRAIEARDNFFKQVLPKASAVLVDAMSSKEKVTTRYGIDAKRVFTMPFSPSINSLKIESPSTCIEIDVKKKYQIKYPYIFYPAQFWPHKNHIYLIRGLLELENKFGHRVDAIFCGGDQGNLGYIKKIISQFGMSERIRFTGFCDDDEIPLLYEQSLALVMPTYFGPTNLPPLEAFRLSTPVLYPEQFKDQVSDAALLIDLNDPLTMASQLDKLLKNPSIREDLVLKGQIILKENGADRNFLVLQEILLSFRSKRICWEG